MKYFVAERRIFIEEGVIYTEKHVSIKRMFTDGFNMGLPGRILDEKTVHRMEKL